MLELCLGLDGLPASALLVRPVAAHYPRCTVSKHTRAKTHTSRWQNSEQEVGRWPWLEIRDLSAAQNQTTTRCRTAFNDLVNAFKWTTKDIVRVVWDVKDVVQFDGGLAVDSKGALGRFDSEFDGTDAQHGKGSADTVG